MAETEWFNCLKSAEKVAVVENNTKKVHYKFKNGSEMVEEYNMDTGVLSKRAWKLNVGIRKHDKWDVEVGEPPSEIRGEDSIHNVGIKESKDSPFIVHRITKTKLEWRIRNMPYELENYSVKVDSTEKSIIVRTSNKKFFKKIPIFELQRLNLTPQQSAVKYSHYLNTLIITYDKPQELTEFDEMVFRELKNVRAVDDGDLNCKPS